MDFDINANHQNSQATLSHCATCHFWNPLKSTRLEDSHRSSKNPHCMYTSRRFEKPFPLLCFCLSSLSQRGCERLENLARNASNLIFRVHNSPPFPSVRCYRVQEDLQPQSKTQTLTNPHFLVLESSATNLLHFRDSLGAFSQKFESVNRLVDCEILQSSVRIFFLKI